LERFEPFQRLGAAARARLAQGLIHRSAHRGAAILHRGQPVSGAYVVLDGRLRVFTVALNGAEATLYFVDPGETCVLALNCLFNDLLYPAWVQALSTLVFRLMAELEQLHSSNHRQRLVQFILLHAGSDGSLTIRDLFGLRRVVAPDLRAS
jgi:CRP/FNR family transcriptional regulator